jgi:sodium transport system permease protein
MGTLFTVFVKEFLDNLRDRRTLLSAMIFGPLFGPLLFGLMISRMLEQSVVEADEPLKITISGSNYAPGLTHYLEAQGAKLNKKEFTETEARAAVRTGRDTPVILMVPEEYPKLFSAASPAPVLLFADSADSQNRKIADRARQLLSAYGGGIAQQRLQIRGINPALTIPVALNDIDVATPSGRAVVVLGFMTYFVLFALLMGGLYLAIDSTAGERERGSLEALLSLPVSRSALVGGKILATCAYMCISLGLSLSAFVVAFRFVPLERIGMSANLGFGTALLSFAICLPFVPLGATLMTLVASFTRTYREAQTYLSMVLLVPTLPIAFASIYSLKTKASLMFIPSLSQHLLMTSVLKDESISVLDVLVSAAASLVIAAILFAITARHWRRETMLG